MDFLQDDDNAMMAFIAARAQARVHFHWVEEQQSSPQSYCRDSALVCPHRLTANLVQHALFSLFPAEQWSEIGRVFGQELMPSSEGGGKPQPTGPKTLYFTAYAVTLRATTYSSSKPAEAELLQSSSDCSSSQECRRIVWYKPMKDLTGDKEDLSSLCRVLTGRTHRAVREIILLHADPLHVSQCEEEELFSEKTLLRFSLGDGVSSAADALLIGRCRARRSSHDAAVAIPVLSSQRTPALWNGLCTQFLAFCAELDLPALLLVVPFEIDALPNTRAAVDLLCAVIGHCEGHFVDSAVFDRWKRLVLASGPSHLYI